MPRPLPLRTEAPPSDTVVVLRAGVLDTGSTTRAAQRTYDLYALYGISVEAVIGTTVAEACRHERIAGYRRVRLSTFGRLRQAGFAILATFADPHFTLVLPDVGELTMRRLDRCFDEAMPNPGRPPRN